MQDLDKNVDKLLDNLTLSEEVMVENCRMKIILNQPKILQNLDSYLYPTMFDTAMKLLIHITE